MRDRQCSYMDLDCLAMASRIDADCKALEQRLAHSRARFLAVVTQLQSAG
jgi:hypothetical protein